MSFFKQLHYARSPLRSPQQDPARQIVPAALFRATWQGSVRFISTAGKSFSDVLFVVLCWITAEFLAGCAHYAQWTFFDDGDHP